MINNVKIEICIGNVDDAVVATKYPIDRIELNSALELGGLSPSLETLRYLKNNIKQDICCMVRNRGGNFYYTELEFELMLKTANAFLENGADGIVFGFLNKDNTIDINRTKQMVDLIHHYNKEAIFHKAFDDTPDKYQAIESLIDLKIDRILTGGGEDSNNIIKGCKLISDLHDKYPDIELLPGGGVRTTNIKNVITIANTNQVHMTSKTNDIGGYIRLEEEQLIQLLKEIETL